MSQSVLFQQIYFDGISVGVLIEGYLWPDV